MNHRVENDAIGQVKVPKNAYYGSFTARALQNFQISGLTAPKEFRVAIGTVKKATALSNMELGELQPIHAKAIIKAADEFISGKFDAEYTLDIFQAGAGTPFNMNANEIIANRANEILGGKKGEYLPVTPNNHVNWGQSSNDVIPSSIKIAALLKLPHLEKTLNSLINELDKKAKEFADVLKVGRTHLQDAVPVSLGEEFAAYSESLKKDALFLKESFQKLQTLSIGGTAIGTGITAHPDFHKLTQKHLAKLLKLDFKPANSLMEMSNNMNGFAIASASLRMLSNNLIRITGDLRILSSGPQSGISEISLPEVEPGSSIMPGKVNPSITECMTMIAYQVIGNDTAINMGVQSSQLELNVTTPMIMHNLLHSMEILEKGINMFTSLCVKGIKANKERCQFNLEKSLCLATGLSAYLGYKKTAELVSEAQKQHLTLKQIVQKMKLMTDKELDAVLAFDKVTKPSIIDKKLQKKIQKLQN